MCVCVCACAKGANIFLAKQRGPGEKSLGTTALGRELVQGPFNISLNKTEETQTVFYVTQRVG